MLRQSTGTLALVSTIVAVALGVGAAGAAPAEADLELVIGASTTITQNPPRTPNGGTVTVTSLDFRVDVEISLVSLSPSRATIHLTLDDRLRWGSSDEPDPTEDCTSTPTTAVCQTPELRPVAGQSVTGWNWPVTAPGPGSYTYGAEIAQASDTDPVPGNNSSAITIVVSPAAPPPPPPPAPPAAGPARVTPAKPKAGSAVSATVRVTAGGAPIRPTAVACTGTIGTTRLRGTPRAASGAATCTYRPPRSARGKTLRGSVSFTARGERFTKRFSARLG